jgi:4-amino-4-deoxy-L-arabinose transferase-like glycosyltransferase
VVLGGGFPWTSFLIPALFRATKKVWQARQQHGLELYLLLWISIIFGFFSIPHSKTISYIFPILPALALLMGNFLSSCCAQDDLYMSRMSLIIGCLILAFILLFIPSHQWFDFSPDFNPYLILIAIVLLFGALGAIFTMRNQTIFPLFSMNTMLSTFILLILLMGASHLNQNTAKPLAEDLKNYLQPEDEVINYFKYYQDIPLYLGRRISIVAKWDAPTIAKKDNWMRELWYGMPLQKTDDWLINESTFLKRWHSNKRIFVFVNDNYLEQFKKQTTHYFYLNQFHDIILISNQPKPALRSS